MTNVSSQAGTFTYGYLVNGDPSPTPLVHKLTLPSTAYNEFGCDTVARLVIHAVEEVGRQRAERA